MLTTAICVPCCGCRGLRDYEWVAMVCFISPPCGVKLLQHRITKSTWLQPRVNGVDANAYAAGNRAFDPRCFAVTTHFLFWGLVSVVGVGFCLGGWFLLWGLVSV